MSECEDSLAIGARNLRYAVADGATEAFDSRRWAQMLTKAWVAPCGTDMDLGELLEAGRRLGDRHRARWQGKPLPWYLEEKARDGAHAAFVGITIREGGSWEAVAIGDSCLFVEYQGDLYTKFPIDSPEGFGYRPHLLPSNYRNHKDYELHAGRTRGFWAPGCRMILMSDAIACWYLEHCSVDNALHQEFHGLLTAENMAGLEALVASERTSRNLRNDDVAVLRLDWPDA
jgi:hypothetical protein